METQTPSPSGSVPRLVRPAWKTPKSEADKEHMAQFRAATLAAALPNASYRLGYLSDADAQFTDLLDHLQSMGVPMGSATWANRALGRIKHLEDIHRATMRLLREHRPDPVAAIERLHHDLEHASKMLVKFTPPMQVICDCCGWPGAKAIGDGWAGCPDCLPNAQAKL